MNIPKPDSIALEHSQALQHYIIEKINNQKNQWISFKDFMNDVLYAPQLGYYTAGSYKLGSGGDFTTAPEMSSLFGKTIAMQIQATDFKQVLELGAGTGKLAYDIINYLKESIDAYYILEISADLKDRQKNYLQQHLSEDLFKKVIWLDNLGDPNSFNGVIVMNEVFDALPVHLIEWDQNNILEVGVIYQKDEQKFNYAVQPIDFEENSELFQIASDIKKNYNLPDTLYVSEINLNAKYLLNSLCDVLNSGIILAIDYGFSGKEFYHADRSSGTLMCHYRHLTSINPFENIGLQDITAHVDFSLLAETAYQKGLNCLGYTTQAHFLMNGGITNLLMQSHKELDINYYKDSQNIQKLLSPAEMGELFKVIGWSKNSDAKLSGFFGRGDLLYQL